MAAILVTGRAGAGKSTLLRAVLETLPSAAGGFFSPEVRDASGRRTGFDVVTLDGQTVPLARVGAKGTHHLGRYGVDIAALDRVGVPAIERAVEAGRLVVIDEIGKMELFSAAFQGAVIEVLRRHRPLLATIMLAAHPFADELKAQPDTTLFELTEANRDDVRGLVEANVRAALGQFSV
ncbi:MAG: nucleoside-triphosphatase [Dehalococcoidia bacterium]